MGARRLPLAFCVDYYGTMENVVRNITGPIQLYLGSEDTRVTPWRMNNFFRPRRSTRKESVYNFTQMPRMLFTIRIWIAIIRKPRRMLG